MSTQKPFSRRQFLQGLGHAAFSIPFLASLAPIETALALAQNSPRRFLALHTMHGYPPSHYFPNYTADTKFGEDLYYRDLRTVTGPINPWLGAKVDPYKSKINLYHGLDITNGSLISSPVFHDSSHALCANFPITYGDANGRDPVQTPGSQFASIDCIMAKSRNFYPTSPRIEALRAAEEFAGYLPSWERTASGGLLKSNYDRNPKTLFNKVFANQIMNPAVADRFQQNKVTFGDLVLEDYQKKMNSRRISAEDKVLLSNFVDHVQETQSRIKSTQPQSPLTCSAPPMRNVTYFQDGGGNQVVTLGDRTNYMRNMMDVIVAAFACDASRIGAYAFGEWNGITDHTPSVNDGPTWVKNMQMNVDGFTYLLQRMESFTDADGKTLLDNSLVYWTSEISESQSHFVWSMPAVTAGSAGGKIKTGYYLDYRQRPFRSIGDGILSPGLPYNRLLISFMAALGLEPGEYTKYGDGKGFGRFYDVDQLVHKWTINMSGATETIRNPWLKYSAVRNQPLPFLIAA